jgi:predicted HTH transcriptional regulator
MVSKYPAWIKKGKEERKVGEEEVFKFIKKVKLFSTREIMDNFKISQRQALKILWKLDSAGKIKNVGHGVWRIRD